MVKKVLGLCAVATLVTGVLVVSRAEAGGRVIRGEVKGTVIAACPQGRMLKLKTDCGRELTLGVAKKAHKDVKALQKGDRVEVSYLKCPKSKKMVVVSVRKL